MTEALQTPIPLSAPHLTGTEEALFVQTNPLEYSALVARFEADLGQCSGAAFVLATPSGTSALELALWALGVGRGDRVVCPSLTFGATANAITNVGARPVFVGTEPTAWSLDPDALETALRAFHKPPKAIMAVDLYGMPAHWPELQRIARQYGVPLVADSAESVGSVLESQCWGTWADLNVVSFNQNKIVTALGGGALLTHDAPLAHKARIIANQGRQTVWPYMQVSRGGNYRMSPLMAGLGLGQLPLLADRVARRRAIFKAYQHALSGPGVDFQPEQPGAVSNRWLTALTIDPRQNGVSRDQLVRAFQGKSIETRPVFAPLHQQALYRSCTYYGTSLAEHLAQTGLCLPSGSGLSDAQVERVISTFRGALEGYL